MSALRWLVLPLGLGWALGGHTQEAPPPAEQPPAESEPRRPAPPLEGDRRADGAEDVFIPSEELAADEEATFPVDI